MRMPLIRAAVGLTALIAASCSQASGKYKELGVEEVVQLQASSAVTFVDANNPDYRKENGMIANAILLPGTKYEVSMLPKDKATALVFYCSNRL